MDKAPRISEPRDSAKSPFYRLNTINSRLTMSFSMLIVIVIGCIIAVTCLFSYRFTQQNTETILHSLDIISNSIESRINIIRKLVPVIRSDDSIMTALENGDASEPVTSRIPSLYAYGLQGAFVITTGGLVLDPNYARVDGFRAFLSVTSYDDFVRRGKEEMFSAPHAFPFLSPPEENRQNPRISYYYALRDRDDYSIYGYAMMVLSIESLFLDSAEISSSLFEGFYVIDGSGNLIYSCGNEPSESLISDFSRESYYSLAKDSHIQVGGDTYFRSTIKSYPDWRVVAVVSNWTLYRNMVAITVIAALIGVIGVMLVIAISRTLSRNITVPIKRINESMTKFETGEMPEKVEITGAGELETLAFGFNHMLDNLRTYLEAIVREQEEKKTAEVAALQYQLQSLQNQINPHFLYNTLNIINFLALDGKSDEIRSFNQSLISLLRSTLSNTQDSVSISRELGFLEAYAHIMEYRYPGMFSVRIHADKSALDCLIPKLILQPLVENAMLHGIFPTGRSGVIEVEIRGEGEQIRVSVNDDGAGIEAEQLEDLFQPRKGFTGIGLSNVNDRLRLCYGSSSVLRISSNTDSGTTVEFSIPKLCEDDKDEKTQSADS